MSYVLYYDVNTMKRPPTKPTSFRFSDDELELLDAIAAHLTARWGMGFNRSDAIRHLMHRVAPPDGAGENQIRWRAAHKKVFGA